MHIRCAEAFDDVLKKDSALSVAHFVRLVHDERARRQVWVGREQDVKALLCKYENPASRGGVPSVDRP